MSNETAMQTRTHATEDENREQAARAASNLIRAKYEDPESWVRLAFSAIEGLSNACVYHFDAFVGPMLSEQHRVIVSCASTDVWEAVLAD